MANPLILYVSSDNLVEITGLKNAATGAFINTATVTGNLYESDGSTLATGMTFPFSLAYVAGSDGDYQGKIEDVTSLTVNAGYRLELIADAGAGLHTEWTIPARAERLDS